jgi:hypothetical protein
MSLMKTTGTKIIRTSLSIPVAVAAALSALPILSSSLIVLRAPGSAIAQEIVSASPDMTIDLGASVIAADEDVAVDNQLGVVVIENLGSLPDASDVTALGLDVNGDRLISFETTTALSGGVVARPGDIVRYDGSVYSIEFDALAAGLPEGVRTDATSLSANGLLLSFDTTVHLGGGLVAADEDLVDWDGNSFGLLLDGSAAGIAAALDIDSAQDVGGGQFLVSFDTSGQVGGVVFDDEDILRFDSLNFSWRLEIDHSATSSSWAAADLDAFMVPEAESGLMLAVGMLWLVSLLRFSAGHRAVSQVRPEDASGRTNG